MNTTAIPTLDELQACKIRLEVHEHVRFAPTLDQFVGSAVLSGEGRDLVAMIFEATVGHDDFHLDVQEARIIGECGPEGTTDLDLQSALTAACLEAVATGHLAEILAQLEGFKSQIAGVEA